MKRLSYIFLFAVVGIAVCLFSCQEDVNGSVFEDNGQNTYIIGINLDVETPLTKGVTNDGAFNSSYEEDCIYLHKVLPDNTDGKGLKIPIYEYECQNPEHTVRCTGFRFQVTKNDDGTFTLQSIGENDNVSEDKLIVSETDNFYFSSIETRFWEISESNIKDFTAPEETTTETNELYSRTKELNKEIYRSQENFTLSEILNLNGQLSVERKCSGFSFLALFNQGQPDKWGSNDLDPDEFVEIMGDVPQYWYIKIYIGNMFTSKYDMQNESGQQIEGGFYGTTDSETFVQNGVDNGYYLPFRWDIGLGSSIGGTIDIEGIGYQSHIDNLLFAPTNSEYGDGLDVYIFIKHWDGEEGTSPSNEWLSSDGGAIYTKITGQNVVNLTIVDGVFYECGAIIDINELKAAAIANGLITPADNAAVTSAQTKRVDEGPAKFVLNNANVFVNY